ncbi:MAG: recombinase family protein [Alphaproteobacteria bacterium]
MRAVIYARYSSDLQSDASIEDQVRICKEHIEREGWTVTSVYTDHAMSGASRFRPGYQKLVEDARSGQFDVIVAEALDRLSRDQEDIAGFYKQISFASVRLITLGEGEINELHVGLKGTMNALFLKDLAAKVRRGLRGRIEAGFSAGGLPYGYKVVRELDSDGELVRGRRQIDLLQANTVRRIYEEYTAGKSPRAIAASLNREGIPGPRGRTWNTSTINGNRARRDGILHNEIYVGRLIYNRLTMRKDPTTGKRVPRINPRHQWVSTEVPDLRIISDEIWEMAQARKARYQGQHFHLSRRPKRLLSGLVHCAICGSPFVVHNQNRYECSGRHERGTCDNNRSVDIDVLEKRVLMGLQDRLLTPECFVEFAKEFKRELRRQELELRQNATACEREIRSLSQQIERLVSAIVEGTDTPASRAKLVELEARKAEIEKSLQQPQPSTNVVLHPNVPDLYRRKVQELQKSLNEPGSRQEASEILRSLIERIVIHPEEGRGNYRVELRGQIASILDLAAGKNASGTGIRVMLVAAEGLEPPTQGL